MATRTLHSDTQTAIEGFRYVNAHLCKFKLYHISTQTEYTFAVTDYFKGLNFNGDYYSPAGTLLNIGGLSDSNKFDITKVNISLSGINRIFISAFLNYQYTSREVIIYKQFFRTENETLTKGLYEPIGTPVQIFTGRIDKPSIKDNPNDEGSVITVQATSIFSDFDKKAGRHTNDTEQKYYHPNDNFFSLWGKIDEDIIWGKKD
jgi:hypothetical protein